MPVCLTILGSGSAGNCAYVETPQARVLVDAGFSLRQIRKRLATIGRTPENLTAIFVTHEHADHVHGLAQLSEKLHIPVYCNRPTQEAIEYQVQTRLECRLFSTGATFEVEDLAVETFSVPHDAQDPVGFLLKTAHGNIGFLTDLGHATKLALERVRHAHVLVLESNHDVKLLQDCPHRPWSLKQRILSRHGHLSNEAAADAAELIMSGDLSHLYLGHLSRECNRPQLAFDVMKQRLQKIGAHHVRLELTSQSAPCPTLTLDKAAAAPPQPVPAAALHEPTVRPEVLECASSVALFGPATESGAEPPHSKTLREERARDLSWVHGPNACEGSEGAPHEGFTQGTLNLQLPAGNERTSAGF